ncbi:hypothetical protein L13192_10106 [Pyrenophora tritici-repentis]|nr:hypothetical protein L13192_10106 [Pyrenophora tritici-repentis]
MAKPTIIGLYGISGSGKSYLLNHVKTEIALQAQGFAFYDGSEVLAHVTPGGLDSFKLLDAAAKQSRIEAALALITQTCLDRGETAVVAGHYMFWNPGVVVAVEKDWQTYTHIVYLDTDPGVIAQRISADLTRHRVVVDEEGLRSWQDKEKEDLRAICREKGILFTTLREKPGDTNAAYLAHASTLLMDLKCHTEAANLANVERALGLALPHLNDLEKVLLFDADKTLAPQDTGTLFWELAATFPACPLKALFTAQPYSYHSFRQAALLYEEEAPRFDALCDRVAATVDMYPEMKALLARAATEPHVGVVLVTCGLRHVWEKVLARADLSHVSIIGGGRLSDGYVVTGAVKGHIVDLLHAQRIRAIAFGDSPLDMPMLQRADEAYVVFSDSCSMDAALTAAIARGYTFAQVLGPAASTVLPSVSLDAIDLAPRRNLTLAHPTTAHLLATPTRDAALTGHALRAAHADMGYYLTLAHVAPLLGLEQYAILHVQGTPTDGHRVRFEGSTLIVPLMRGGESMAFGVSRALPHASFAHARHFADIVEGQMRGVRCMVVVDSVVNSGASVLAFVADVRALHPALRVVVVAGVVQAGAVESGSALMQALEKDRNLSVVALRVSGNKYKGKGGTDTGHRLFNTTMLE